MSERMACGHHKRFLNRNTQQCQACAVKADRAHHFEPPVEPDENDFLVDERYGSKLRDALGQLGALFPQKQKPIEALASTDDMFKLDDFSACPLSELHGFDADEMTVDVAWLKRVCTYLTAEHKSPDLGVLLADEVLILLGHHLEVASL